MRYSQLHKGLTLGLVLALGYSASLCAQELLFPVRAVIQIPTKDGVAIRESPPEVSALTYQLAGHVCGLANGSTVIALNQVFVANGETWFQVLPDRVTRYIGQRCPPKRLGWMVAKTKRGWVVGILEQNVRLDEPPSIPTVEPPVEAPTTAPPPSKHKWRFSSDYLLLVLGSFLGILVVTIERGRSLDVRSWPRGFLCFEVLTAIVVNAAFCALVKDQLYLADRQSVATAFLQTLEASPLGYGLLGFVLSLVFAKFLSFAKA